MGGTLKKERPKLRLLMNKLPALESVRVAVPKIAYDEELDCFHIDYSDGISLAPAVKALPANFHTHEAMDVDASDVASLLDFQRQWGLVTLHTRVPLRPGAAVALGDVIGSPTLPDYDSALDLLEELDKRHPGFKTHASLQLTMGDVPKLYPFVPRAEVEAAVEYLQATIGRLTRAAADGYDEWEGIDEMSLRIKVEEVGSAVTPYFPLVRMALPKEEGDMVGPPLLPVTIAALAQMCGYLTATEGYRECPECHRLFVYKRHTAGTPGRNRRSVYCSDTCQINHSTKAQGERRKAERQAKKAERENGGR